DARKRALVIGAGPSGLEYARVAAARGHDVVVLEREEEAGGHVRWQSLLPGRKEYGQIARWLERQAAGNGAEIRTGTEVAADRLAKVEADWLVMATGRRSENGLYHALRERGVSVEMIGDAIAPRGTYEAVFEGHRAARKL